MKSELTHKLRHVKSSHRCEALARGLQFRTYAAALAAARAGEHQLTDVRGDLFAAYLNDHGLQEVATPLYLAAAKVALKEVATLSPRLTIWGVGSGGRKRVPSGGREDVSEMNTRFQRERNQLLGDEAAKPFLASLSFLKLVKPTKTVRNRAGSYWVKHIAEKYPCFYPEGGELGPIYVPNGVFIAAAIYAGFDIRTSLDARGYDDINASFNMSLRGLKDLDCEFRPDGARAQERRRAEERRRSPLLRR